MSEPAEPTRRMPRGTAALMALACVLVLGSAAGPAGTSQGQGRGLIAFFSDRAGVGDLYVFDPETMRTRRLTRGGAVSKGTFDSLSVLFHRPPAWAPDASALLFVNADRDRPRLHVVDVDGRRVRALALDAWCAAWSPNGRLIAFTRSGPGHDIWLMRADGTAKRRLVRNGLCPKWSPNGATIAFTSRAGVEVVSSDGSGRRRLARARLAAGWSPEGTEVLFTRERDDEVDLFVAAVQPGSSPRLLVEDGSMPVWSPRGDYIAYVGSRSLGPPPSSDVPDISAIRPDGTDQRWLSRDHAGDLDPTWSPDGTQVAFANDLTFTREWRSGDEIFVAGIDGSGRRRLTHNKAYDIAPAWSPVR